MRPRARVWRRKARPGDLYLGVRAGPIAPVEGHDRELDDDLIGRKVGLSGGLLDAIPMLGGDLDVLQ